MEGTARLPRFSMRRSQVELFESVRVPISLARFMELMRADAARDLVRRINKCMQLLSQWSLSHLIRFTQEMEVVRKPDAVKDSRLVQVCTGFLVILSLMSF